MNRHDRIVIDPEILVGKPVVKGTRLSVDFLLGLLAQGWGESEILRNYPGLEREDLLACWAYASEALNQEKVYRFQVADTFKNMGATPTALPSASPAACPAPRSRRKRDRPLPGTRPIDLLRE